MSEYYYKLTEKETRNLLSFMGIPIEAIREFIKVAKSRSPNRFLPREVVLRYRIWLNRPQTIAIQPVHFYGGEHFGEPHYFIGEIISFTTQSAFSRFIRQIARDGFKIPLRTFTY